MVRRWTGVRSLSLLLARRATDHRDAKAVSEEAVTEAVMVEAAATAVVATNFLAENRNARA